MRILFCFLLLANNCFSQIRISAVDARNDIDTMNLVIETVHVNPYTHISKKDYVEKSDSIKASISDSIDLKDFVLKLYKLTSFIGDAHTQPAFTQSIFRSEFAKPQYFPGRFYFDDAGSVFFRNENHSSAQPVKTINGKDIIAMAAGIQNSLGGRSGFRRELGERIFSNYLFLSGIQPPFSIRYANDDVIRIDSGVGYRKALSYALPSLGKPPYEFKIIDGRLGYLNFVSMSGTIDQMSSFLDSCFAQMRRQGIKSLAVDIRENSGGNSILGDLLLAYVTRKKFSLMGYRLWKVSAAYKEYLLKSGNKNSDYLSQKVGSVWKLGKCAPNDPKFIADTVFDGKVYLLTSPFTFSSANMLADGVKAYKLATIVGEETGEDTNDFGEVYSFVLPNSKIAINATTSYDIGARCNEKEAVPILPDVLIKTSVRQKLSGIDPVLEYVLKQARIQ